jgi:hypothetical protein
MISLESVLGVRWVLRDCIYDRSGGLTMQSQDHYDSRYQCNWKDLLILPHHQHYNFS